MTISIIQYRSAARTCARQRRILHSLGLRKIGSMRELPNNPCVRGMVDALPHLVKILKK